MRFIAPIGTIYHEGVLNLNLDISSLTEWIARFKTLNGIQRTELLTIVGKSIGNAAKEQISDYPEASGKPLTVWYNRTSKDGRQFKSKFKSAKQQGFVMGALVAKGKVPYSRTGKLGKSFSVAIRGVTPTGVIVSVGTDTSYAPYVLDEGWQSNYHKGTWHTIQSDLIQGMPQIVQTAKNAFTVEVNRRLTSG